MNFNSINNIKVSFFNRECDFCGKSESKEFRSSIFLAKKFTFVKCSNCGLVYQNPLIDIESREKIYNSI